MTDVFAHAPKDKDSCKSLWNPLATHLKNVGKLSSRFAIPAMQDIAKHTGQWHDLGKYRPAFQKYLRGKACSSKNTHHSVYGAALAAELNLTAACFAIAGHHAGLHNPGQLKEMLHHTYPNLATDLPELKKAFQAELAELPSYLQEPDFVQTAIAKNDLLSQEFYIRMLFSCLTDADLEDAKRFALGLTELPTPSMLEHHKMIPLLQKHMRSFKTEAGTNKIRNEIHQHCIDSAPLPQGIFQLTVPTGGGKTLAAMRFALEHAKTHNLERVIVIIPYLSIIEQNAEVYRNIFDPKSFGFVVEHHSNLASKEDEEEKGLKASTKLADNWDAPIVISTTVQFIESLFSHKPSRARKLHNIARSVVLLDEVHTLPHHLLDPLLNVLRELTSHYQTSIVLSTATQPAFQKSPHLQSGFASNEIHEIIPDPQKYFSQLLRVSCSFMNESVDYQSLTQSVKDSNHQRVLGIVNTRSQARKWYQEMAKQHNTQHLFHLSAAMCAEHRSQVLQEINTRLKTSTNDPQAAPCYLISTQVVEAGVDLDFPVVYRAVAPLDAIIQAAGRCNREGNLPQMGQMIVFQPTDTTLPPGSYALATQLTLNMLKSTHSNNPNLTHILTDPKTFANYFEKLFPYVSPNEDSETTIQELRRKFCYREVSKKAKVIDKKTTAIVVPYKKAEKKIEEILSIYDKTQYAPQKLIRSLQRYMVNVYDNEFAELRNKGMLKEKLSDPSLWVLDKNAYHPKLGIVLEEKHTNPL